MRSTESLMATDMTVRDVAFREKNLQGNQNFRQRKPVRASAAMARLQERDAAAM